VIEIEMQSESLTIERFEGANYEQRVLRLIGPLTASTALPFQNTLRGENAATIILDLSRVPYMDSSGLGSLVGTYVSCQKSGRRMAQPMKKASRSSIQPNFTVPTQTKSLSERRSRLSATESLSQPNLGSTMRRAVLFLTADRSTSGKWLRNP
jgi:ABC-type transporter Mla MlaB component